MIKPASSHFIFAETLLFQISQQLFPAVRTDTELEITDGFNGQAAAQQVVFGIFARRKN